MNERLTLQDLVDILAQKQDMTKKDAEVFLRELIAVISETIEQNDPVKIKDFGTFKLVKVNARKSVDVNTGEAIEIPAHYKLSFVPDKSLKEAVNHPFAHFESVVLEEGISFENVETVETNDEGEEVDEADDYKEDEILPEPIAVDVEIEAGNKTTLTDSYTAIVGEEKESESVKEINPTDDKPATIAESTASSDDIIAVTTIDDEATDVIKTVQSETTETTEIVIEKVVDNFPPEEEKLEDTIVSDEKVIEKETGKQDVEDTSSETESEMMFESHKRKTIRRRFVSLGFILFLIVGAFALGGLYFQQIMNCFTENIQKDNTVVSVEKEEAIKAPAAIVTDTTSVAINTTDSTAFTVSEKQEETGIRPSATIKDTIKSGSTLRMMSLKHFGHKSFWPYIYEENKDVIKNPNNVPLGTELIIPSVEKYGIDAKDQESIKKAKEMESKLIREFNL